MGIFFKEEDKRENMEFDFYGENERMSNRTLSEKQANQALLELLKSPEKIRISDIENII